MSALYGAWFEFTGWIGAVLLWLYVLQPELIWWQPAVLWLLFALLFFLTRKVGADGGALPFAAVLVLCGWVFLTRLDPKWAAGQFAGALLGGLAFLLGVLLPVSRISRHRLFGAAALLLLAVTALFGQSAGGARAWLELGGLRFQPVELARVLFILYLAQQLTREGTWWEVVLALFSLFALLAWQRDLGPVLLVFFVYCWLSLHHRFSWYKLLIYLGTAAAGFGAGLIWFPHFQSRTAAWLRPWDYPDSKGYQVLQGLFALRSGGVVGQGVGLGLAQVIPQAHTDYLFAVIGEELGFLGAAALLLCYLALAFWALRIVDSLTCPRQRLMGLGLTLLLHCQVFLVVGGMLRLVPFSGMTLPLVSFGSTSLVAQLWMLGLLTGLSRSGGES